MKTALIAFDSDQFNLILTKMLQDFGFYVISTTNFEDAVSLCEQKKPNIIFLDWNLDNRDIHEFFKKTTYHPCVILVSATTDPKKLQEALDMGAREYIMKPFDNDILQSKLSLVELL